MDVFLHRSLYLWQEIHSYYRNNLAGIVFLWEEIICFFLFLWPQEILLVTGNIILQQEMLFRLITVKHCGYSDRYFLWGGRISCHLGCQDARKNPTLATSATMWHQVWHYVWHYHTQVGFFLLLFSDLYRPLMTQNDLWHPKSKWILGEHDLSFPKTYSFIFQSYFQVRAPWVKVLVFACERVRG